MSRARLSIFVIGLSILGLASSGAAPPSPPPPVSVEAGGGLLGPYTPPACVAGVPFADVTCTTPYDAWIEQFARDGVTGGCGGGNYCPGNPNTRGQMAVFLTKTFGLVLYGP